MNSRETIIIQLALRPMMVVTIRGTEYTAVEVADFSEFFEVIKNIALSIDSTVLVNRGPGSYSGIRTAVAYAYGLIHGGRVPSEQIRTFTSFDLAKATTNHQGPIYFKAWPRLATGKLAESKGYYAEAMTPTGKYVEFSQIEREKHLLALGEEAIKTEIEYLELPQLLNDPVGYRELAENSDTLPTSLDPLYINPVHIT